MNLIELVWLVYRDAALSLLYRLVQWSWWPARRVGSFGTPDDALEFSKGSEVPWWLECRWPVQIELTFMCDCESYFENGYQVVRPLWRAEAMLMEVKNAAGLNIFICGAPTAIFSEPRPRRRQPARRRLLELQPLPTSGEPRGD